MLGCTSVEAPLHCCWYRERSRAYSFALIYVPTSFHKGFRGNGQRQLGQVGGALLWDKTQPHR